MNTSHRCPTTRIAVSATAVLTLLSTLPCAAFYNAQTGRWLSRDPAREASFKAGHEQLSDPGLKQVQAAPHSFVCNDPIGKWDYLGLDPNIAPGTTFTVSLQGGGSATAVVGRHFTKPEKDTGLRALCLVRKILGSPPYIPPFSDVYWATFTGGTPIDGMTMHNGSILISSSMKPTCSFPSIASFGAVLAHEADHFYTHSDDGPGGPEDRINTPVLDALRKTLRDAVCGCCNGQWQLENMLGHYACECGLQPCKPKPCLK